jgi:peptide/nickel transport system substrate-binding protein
VAHAIDSETICKQVIGGFAVPVGSITPSTAFGYNENVKPYKYDPQLAKQYLENSGYKGEVIDFLSTNGKYFMDMEVNTAIAGYLKAIGINVNLQLTDWPSWMAKFNSRKIEPICLYGWCDNSGDAVENLFDFAHKRSPYNWSDEKGIAGLDKLIDTAQTVVDMKIRGEALEKANQLLNEYYHCGLYYNPVKVFGARKGIKNWFPRADESIYISNKVEKSF